MAKTRVTVSIEKTVFDNAKLTLLKRGRTLSDYIETSLRSLSGMEILGGLCRELNLECGYIRPESVEMNRPDLSGKAFAEREVKELRSKRASRSS